MIVNDLFEYCHSDSDSSLIILQGIKPRLTNHVVMEVGKWKSGREYLDFPAFDIREINRWIESGFHYSRLPESKFCAYWPIDVVAGMHVFNPTRELLS